MFGCLPEDLIREEILLKLRAKSLLRFKLVSKGWYAIITNPSFVKNHFNAHHTDRGGLVLYCQARKIPKELWGYSGDDRCFYSHVPTANPNIKWNYALNNLLLWGQITFIRGPCNGIFCIHTRQNKFALWNPTTRRVRLIHCSPTFLFDEVGFGVDPLTGDFKIVLIGSNGLCGVSSSFAVYSSTTNSWKYLEQESLCDTKLNVTTFNSSRYTFLNGYYYWSKHSLPEYPSSIFAFDMHNEIFEDIETPTIEERAGMPGLLHLFNENSLAFVSQYEISTSTYFIIWLMKEKGQWTLSLSVQVPLRFYDVVCFWGHGTKMILQPADRKIRGLINMDLDSLKIYLHDTEIPSTHAQYKFMYLHYKESLFALSVEAGVEDYDIRSPESLHHFGYKGKRTTHFGCQTFRIDQGYRKHRRNNGVDLDSFDDLEEKDIDFGPGFDEDI